VIKIEKLKCYSCNKELTNETQIEYSNWLKEYFCNPDCAADSYFNYMESYPFNLDINKDELKERGIKLVNGKLYKTQK